MVNKMFCSMIGLVWMPAEYPHIAEMSGDKGIYTDTDIKQWS